MIFNYYNNMNDLEALATTTATSSSLHSSSFRILLHPIRSILSQLHPSLVSEMNNACNADHIIRRFIIIIIQFVSNSRTFRPFSNYDVSSILSLLSIISGARVAFFVLKIVMNDNDEYVRGFEMI